MKTPKKKTRKKLTEEKKTQYMRIGLGMCEVGVTNKVAELIWRYYEAQQELKEEFSLRDASEITAMVEEKYAAKQNAHEALLREVASGLKEVKEMLNKEIQERNKNKG